MCACCSDSLLTTLLNCRQTTDDDDRCEQRAWLLSCVQDIWNQFAARFKSRWTEAVAHGRAGEACPTVLFGAGASDGMNSLLVVQDAFLAVRSSRARIFGCCIGL